MFAWTFSTLLVCTLVLNVVHSSVKKGVVHIGQDYKCGDFDVLTGMNWWYDYTPGLNAFQSFVETKNCPESVYNYPESSTHVPMIWSAKWGIPEVNSTAAHVLLFNEPNHKLQGNMTATNAVEVWQEVIQNAQGKSLVSPSAAPCGTACITNTAYEWFDQFFSLCQSSGYGHNCGCDYIATHIFNCDPDGVMKTLQTMSSTYNRTIWLTEFTCSETVNPFVMLLYMQVLLPQLEEATFVSKYAWYKARVITSGESGSVFVSDAASLLEQNSSTLTTLGSFYVGYQGGPVQVENISAHDFNETSTPLKELIGVFKPEAMVVLTNYLMKPSEWYIILDAITWNFGDLPSSAQAFYITSTKLEKKTRIRSFFDILMCENEASIAEQDVWNEVVRIKAMNETVYEEKKGRLKVPSVC